MRKWAQKLRRLPGWIASSLMILVTTVWAFWGAAEMYHEGWWGAWYNRLPYLSPLAVTLIPALIAFRWPLVGGGLILLLGVWAAFFFRGGAIILSAPIALIGALFLTDGIVKRRSNAADEERSLPWWRRHWRTLLAVGLPLVVFVAVSIRMLPIVLTRVDDGDRSARRIEGNGVTLIWAPEGPGWNWKQPWGGYPSWQSVALYGVPPTGLEDKPGYGRQGDEITFATEGDMEATNLCRYLNADGTHLMDEPQDVWRMPTTEDVVRSLVRHGENAGCEWNGGLRQSAECEMLPDKESPLWATDHPAVYYWTADAYNEKWGMFVSYNGMVNATYKLGGNPRHSYRCVREP